MLLLPSMKRSISLRCVAILALVLASSGCESHEKPLVEITFDDLNQALERIEQSGEGLPETVQELTNLPALQGKTLPQLPPGFYLAVDPETRTVAVRIDEASSIR